MYGKATILFAALSIGLSASAPVDATAQSFPISYRTSFSATGGSESRLPFWLHTNRFGVVDPSGANAGLRVAATSTRPLGKRHSYALGIDAISRLSPHRALFFQQYYGELRLGPFSLRAGQREETAGMVHPYLSLGSMIVSPNAAPMPRISISWPDYVPVPGTDEFVAVKGYLGHGWIGGSRIVNNPFLHEKSFYIRVGGKNWPVHGHGGVMHYAVWGGTHVNPNVGRLPSSFRDYLRVFFAQGAEPQSGLPPEVANVLGNALGAYDFKLDVDLQHIVIRAYRQFYLEDTVSLGFRNGWDGLWGLSLAFPNEPAGLRTVLYEHVNTKRQSCKSYEMADGENCTDNYYNHGVYGSGWTHQGRTIGMPLILTAAGFQGNVNNILLGHHVALEGRFQTGLSYTLFLTYSRNYGARSILDETTLLRIEDARTPARHQYALMLELSKTLWPAPGIDGFVRVAYDRGDVLPDRNFGLTIGFARTHFLK